MPTQNSRPNFMRTVEALHAGGRPDDAARMLEAFLADSPTDAEAWLILAKSRYAQNRHEHAAAAAEAAIRLDPRSADALYWMGRVQRAAGARDLAADYYRRALAICATHADALTSLGVLCRERGDLEEAIALYAQALAVRPDHAAAARNLANARTLKSRAQLAAAVHARERGDLAGAGALCEQILSANPDDLDALLLAATIAGQQRSFERSLELVARALERDPANATAYNLRGIAQKSLKRYAAALASYERASTLRPEFPEPHFNRGNVWLDLRQPAAAIEAYERALELNGDYADAYEGRGNARLDARQYAGAAADYDRAWALKGDLGFLRGLRRHVKMQLGDWQELAEDLAAIRTGIERGAPICAPLPLLGLSDSPALQLECARIWVAKECAAPCAPPFAARARPGERLRVGYFSADFRDHPVAILMAEVLELHDRSRFEVHALSYGPDTADALRSRVRAAVEHFIDLRDASDEQIVLAARALGLDIAVDLTGFTRDGRPRIFAARVAPLQASYLGYLGTSGAAYMDYLLADRTLVPASAREFYSEKLLYLPSYQANDSQRRIAPRSFTRGELGLPARGFVYCCFNASYKITPETFTVWMRILLRVPDSVLFLHSDGPTLEANLRAAAQARGVAGTRLVFGAKLPADQYLARYRAADLFLDTLPYNAGTTASDALWAGLPLLTCLGRTFAGRMAASLLQAIDLPELVADDWTGYERLAVDLARDPARHAALKRRLASNRETSRLFDARRFCRSLERGYAAIHARHAARLPPDHVLVPEMDHG